MLPLQWSGWKWTAFSWLFLITFLFFLPGSALPKETWLQKLQVDKLIHIGFFAVLLFLWRFILQLMPKWPLLLGALSYGILIEIIQHKWIANRSADLWDVAADMAGALAGLLVWDRVYKKNKPL